MKTVANIVEIPVHQIIPGDNDRTVFESQALRALADSIQADGLMQPITVRLIGRICQGCKAIAPRLNGFPHIGDCIQVVRPLHQIVAGERRFRAISLLGGPPSRPSSGN